MRRPRITVNAPVVLGFVFLCFLVTFLNFVTLGASNRLLFITYHSSLKSPLTYVRFFTHILGHDGWPHFIGNATYILLLGPMLEEKHGSRVLVFIILITALVTALINYIFFPGVGICGASGVVFAFILLTSFTGFFRGEIPATFILVAIIFLGQQIIDAMTFQDNISNMAHIVGGLVGAIAGYRLNRQGGSYRGYSGRSSGGRSSGAASGGGARRRR